MRNPQNLFSTITRDLSDCDAQYKSALWGIVKDNKTLRRSTSPLKQVEQLIEPSKHLHCIGPLIIVIDAIDECGDRAGRRLPLWPITPFRLTFAFSSPLDPRATSSSHLGLTQIWSIKEWATFRTISSTRTYASLSPTPSLCRTRVILAEPGVVSTAR